MIEISGWLIEKSFRPIFRRFSVLGNRVFFNKADFPVAAVLEDNYDVIKLEFEKIRRRIKELPSFQDISPDQIYISQDDKWKMFFLKTGKLRFDRNCQEFPETMKIIDSDPNLVSAYFSVIGPNKMLMPHEGPWCGILRMHLGIDIPTDGKGCVLVANKEEYRWEEGKVVVFDDTYEHFAVNLTDHDRVVLFLDYMRPLPWPLNWLNHFVVYMARYMRYFKEPVKRHKVWEESFYKQMNKAA